MIGEGEAFYGGERMPAVYALGRAGLEPVVLGPKEGLALLNGTQFSTAHALLALFAIERVFRVGTDQRRARRPMRHAAPIRRSIRASRRCAGIADRSTSRRRSVRS